MLDHSSIQNLSRLLIFFVCAHGLPSSIQTTGSIGFKFGDRAGYCKIQILCPINHFFVSFDVCLGLLSCCKIHLRPSYSLLAEATRFLAKMSWYWVMYMMPLTLTRAPGPVGTKWPHNIKDPPPYFTVGMGLFSAYVFSFRRQTHHWCVCGQRALF